jgi:hypothetical protein
MNKLVPFVILQIALASLFSCARPGDILLSYTDGKITRKDFYSWISANHYPLETVIKNKAQQKNLLQTMSIEIITCNEAQKNGFINLPYMKLILDLTEKRILSQEYFSNVILPKASISEDIVFADVLFFRNNALGSKSKTATGTDLAQKALSDLEKGSTWEKISSRYADNINCVKKTMPLFEDNEPKEIGKAGLSLKKGEYSKTPIILKDGIYLIHANDRITLSYKDAISNKDNRIPATRVIMHMKSKARVVILDDIIKKRAAVFNEKTVTSSNPNELIFKTSKTQFTKNDFKEILNVYREQPSFNVKTNDELVSFCRNLFELYLLSEEAQLNKYTDDDIMTKIQYIKNALVTREYIRHAVQKDSTVSESDVLSEQTKYNRLSRNDRSIQNKTLSYSDIKKQLIERAVAAKSEEWKRANEKKYAVTLYENKLEGK